MMFSVECFALGSGYAKYISNSELGINISTVNLEKISGNSVLFYGLCGFPTLSIINFSNISDKKIKLQAAYIDKEEISFDLYWEWAWYKDANASKSVRHSGESKLIKELLIKDPELVRVDSISKENHIRFGRGEDSQYYSTKKLELITIPDRNGRVIMSSDDMYIEDAKELMPVFLYPGNSLSLYTIAENNCLTKHVAKTKLLLSIGSNQLVLPIKYEFYSWPGIDVPIRHGVYYRALLNANKPLISSERKTTVQLERDLSLLKRFRINYPTIYSYQSKIEDLETNMQIRKRLGFPTDAIYIIDPSFSKHLAKMEWTDVVDMIDAYQSFFKSQEYKNVYLYLVDEPKKEQWNLLASKVKNIFSKSKMRPFLAGRIDRVSEGMLEKSAYIISYEPVIQNSKYIHSYNSDVFAYAYPQTAIINPMAYRIHYGIDLIRNDYDGAMLYSYQDQRGSLWSDFDSRYRDHMLVYPTSDGLLLTNSFIAYAEAVTDVHWYYLAKFYFDEMRKNESCNLGYRIFKESSSGEKTLHMLVKNTDKNNIDNYRKGAKNIVNNLHGVLEKCNKH